MILRDKSWLMFFMYGIHIEHEFEDTEDNLCGGLRMCILSALCNAWEL
jgi:hypothetical protein